MSQTGQMIPLRDKVNNVRDMFAKMKSQLALALPKHITPDRMLRVAMTCVQRTPLLLDCTRESLAASLIQASQLGLEPDGIRGLAWLIPFRNKKKNVLECQFMPGYRGLVDLARRTGLISTIYAQPIYVGDSFQFRRTAEADVLEYEEADTDEIERKLIKVYALARLKDGGVQIEVMRRAAIDRIRNGSQAANNGPWVTHYDEMAKKTVIRRISKLLPSSVELQRAIALDDAVDAGVSQVDLLEGGDIIDIATQSDGEQAAEDATPTKPSKLDVLTEKHKAKADEPPTEPGAAG